ncbi:ankyrin repeat domain-containing protein [Dokdonia sinensis]|uniref:Ankyrin repeat domain-containing protein n=1 Tax=Dokdonia sinensis TaxID=2479847 RepID=A0A3M0G9F3_9FLAO|nr:ankyrin repeat domain-containing protein [Dokdonia sinensis]RMB61048.1 ankyrin repeat domain-containing protein [Dokdonia sinensis]
MKSAKVSFFIIFLLGLFLQKALAQDVFDIARNGTSDELVTLLAKHPDTLNTKNAEGYSPLILAAYHANFEVAKELLKNGASINEESNYGSAIMAATVKGAIKIVQLLLEYGADPNVTDANGTTALLYATMFQQNEIATLLLNYKADTSLKDNRGNTALDYAILMKNETLTNLLKKHL